MISPAHTQLIMHAVGHMGRMSRDKREMELGKIKLQGLAMQLEAGRGMMDTQAALFRDLIHSMIDRRVDAIQQGFVLTMGLYADQATHYMSQQEKFATAEINATDPIVRGGYHSRNVEIDMQLKRIRSDAAKLYREMTSAILLVGGSMPSLPSGTRSSLRLN